MVIKSNQHSEFIERRFRKEFGSLCVEFAFSDEKYYNEYVKFMSGYDNCNVDKSRPVDVKYTITSERINFPDKYVQVGNVFVFDQGFFVKERNFIYKVSLDGETVLIMAKPLLNKKRRVLKLLPITLLQRFTNGGYFSLEDLSCRSFHWAILNYTMYFSLVRKGASWIHAASVMNEQGEVALFTGWGGSGKTSSSSYLTLENNKILLSDDLSIVDKSGTCFSNGRNVHIYPYNLVNNPKLLRAMQKNQSLTDKIHWYLWRLKGPKSVVRWVPLSLVYPRFISNGKNKLKYVVYLERGNETDRIVKISNVNPEEIAIKAANVIMYEMKSAFLPVTAVNSIKHFEWFPSLSELFERTKEIYKGAFTSSENYILKIPLETDPSTLSNYILRNVLPHW